MTTKNIFNFAIGLIAIILFLYYIISFLFKNSAIEPMTNATATDKDKISSAVDGNTNKLSDILLISKYRSNYEDTILSLEKTIGLSIVSEVIANAELISSDTISPESMKAIANINQLAAFKESLNQAMIEVDKN